VLVVDTDAAVAARLPVGDFLASTAL